MRKKAFNLVKHCPELVIKRNATISLTTNILLNISAALLPHSKNPKRLEFRGTSDVAIFESRIVDRDPAPESSRIADRDTTAIKTNDIVDCNFLVMAHKNTCGIHVRSHVNTFRPGLRCQHCALVTFAHPFSRPLTQKGFSISPLPAHLHRPDGNIRDIILYIYIYIYILRLSLWQPDPLRKDTVRLTSLFLKDYRTLLIFNETI